MKGWSRVYINASEGSSFRPLSWTNIARQLPDGARDCAMEDAIDSEFLLRLRSGDSQAATQIFQRFATRLAGLARTRLNGAVRQAVDPEDVVQSVFRTFFAHQAEGEFTLPRWSSFWSLLAMITLRKCGHRTEHLFAACRDLRRQVSLAAELGDIGSFEAIAREPTPLESALFAEVLQDMFAAFEPRQRQIIELRLQGRGVAEIATTLECTERTVHRVLKRGRNWLLTRLRDDRE